jgi:hypothetical protein
MYEVGSITKSESPWRCSGNDVVQFEERVYSYEAFFFLIWFVRLLALRPLLAYCASLGG